MGLRKSTQRYLESELSNYRHIDKDIQRVREEVLNPWQPTDTNIGGDRVHSNVSVTEIKATRVVNDRRLSQLARMKSAIDIVYRTSSKESQQLMDIYYFKKPRTLNLTGVAQEICVSKSTAYELRREILTKLADELGIMH
ncbi:transcriptional regulator [Staphylococcus pettenkoferi]|uniref:transcriptional regulator n=1 Tax=Staphylococcus pettenkoferi TaxID=170573 RepID=UPI0022740CD2|nr:transcriptional regulator [Staphylococcus pettenkoferi]MCY1587594.1 transcriptional regulator [Staphylococcus pettenkoferi]